MEVSSSVGLGIHKPEDPSIRLFQSPRCIDGVLEVPISSYIGADHRFCQKTRLATLIGMGLAEQSAWLDQAEARQLPLLVLLSHVSEFHTPIGSDYRRNTLTERKFEQLCSRLSESSSLRAVTISELASIVDLNTDEDDTPLTLPRWQSTLRFLEAAKQKVLRQ